MSKVTDLVIASAMLGIDPGALLARNLPYRVGVTSAKPDDPERQRKADERRARRQAARPNARIAPRW